jgi:hypothetical protein
MNGRCRKSCQMASLEKYGRQRKCYFLSVKINMHVVFHIIFFVRHRNDSHYSLCLSRQYFQLFLLICNLLYQRISDFLNKFFMWFNFISSCLLIPLQLYHSCMLYFFNHIRMKLCFSCFHAHYAIN